MLGANLYEFMLHMFHFDDTRAEILKELAVSTKRISKKCTPTKHH